MDRRTFLKYSLMGGAGAVLAPGVIPGFGIPYARAASPLKVGLMIPLSGPAGLFGPSDRDCAELAVSEINARGGILGRPLQLLVGDTGGGPAQATQTALKFWRGEGAEVFIGNHNSAVRAALSGLFKGQIPYIYTPVCSGDYCGAGTYILGETPEQQLAPVIPWLASQKELKRWYLIGNDYSWPRISNAAAKKYIAASHGQVVGEEYLPFTVNNFDSNLAKIKATKADVVLITLVGGASVGFNRAFASFGLAEKVLRLGTLIEENTLAGIGEKNSQNLYSALGYFAAIDTPTAKSFAADFKGRFGSKAPLLNTIGESSYEGALFLEAIAKKAGAITAKQFDKVSNGVSYTGPRGKMVMDGRYTTKNIYLAQAHGTAFKVVHTFPQVGSGQTCKVA